LAEIENAQVRDTSPVKASPVAGKTLESELGMQQGKSLCGTAKLCTYSQDVKNRSIGEQMDAPLSNAPEARENVGWWALYIRHQHEKVVAEMLCAKGFEVFLPLYQSQRRWNDRVKLLSLPLFPCYLFVRGGNDRRTQAAMTPGVHMILSLGDQAAIIPDTEVLAIRRTIEGHFRVEPHPYLKCGDKVRVKRGTLEGLVGILVRKKNLCRLVLSVDMLERSIGVEIDAADVEPVSKLAKAALLSATNLHTSHSLRRPPEGVRDLAHRADNLRR
jgi:transcription antitermination factor NusG